jgi:hypothetical protein
LCKRLRFTKDCNAIRGGGGGGGGRGRRGGRGGRGGGRRRRRRRRRRTVFGVKLVRYFGKSESEYPVTRRRISEERRLPLHRC